MADFQDWTPVVLKPRVKKTGNKETDVNNARRAQPASVDTQKKFNAGTNKQHVADKNMKALDDETEDFGVKHVGLSLAQKIQQARAAKGWAQKDLAMRIAEKPSVVTDYESGKAIPNNQIIQKMEKALGAKLR